MEAVWFAKTDGRVYGPVSVEKLAAWAREGRLDSTSLISKDRVNWSPAPLKAALGMNWLVETEVGAWFGPFHHDVVEELFEANQVPAGARLYRLTARQVATPPPPPAPPPLPKETEELQRLVKETKVQLAKEAKERERLAKENEKLKKENEKLAKEKKGKGLGGLFFGKRSDELAQIELAVQRELAAAKQRSEESAAKSEVIDIA